jgi:hypothetical protein
MARALVSLGVGQFRKERDSPLAASSHQVTMALPRGLGAGMFTDTASPLPPRLVDEPAWRD